MSQRQKISFVCYYGPDRNKAEMITDKTILKGTVPIYSETESTIGEFKPTSATVIPINNATTFKGVVHGIILEIRGQWADKA